MKILLGTTSELKLSALNKALATLGAKYLEGEAISVETQQTKSGVPETPYEQETYRGAKNRALSLMDNSFDLFIGLESGLLKREGKLYEECWCVILDTEDREAVGISSAIQLPQKIVAGLNEGKKHTDLLDELGEQSGVSSKDTWGVYSKGLLSRSESMFEACRNALISYFIRL